MRRGRHDINLLPFSRMTLPVNELSRAANVADDEPFFIDDDVLTVCGEKSFIREERNR